MRRDGVAVVLPPAALVALPGQPFKVRAVLLVVIAVAVEQETQAQEFTRWLADRQYSREQKRKLIDGFFISDARLEIASEARAAGITTASLGNWLQKSSRDDIKSMPCLGLFREVLRQKHLNPGTS